VDDTPDEFEIGTIVEEIDYESVSELGFVIRYMILDSATAARPGTHVFGNGRFHKVLVLTGPPDIVGQVINYFWIPAHAKQIFTI
jgi:hypothetical protein